MFEEMNCQVDSVQIFALYPSMRISPTYHHQTSVCKPPNVTMQQFESNK